MDKYDEALAKARELHGTIAAGRDFLAEIFPELRESEDERIRKAIMEVLKRVSGATDVLENQGTTFKKAMIWLEKQKDKRELDFAEGKVEGVKQTCQEIKDAMSLFEPKDLTPFEFTFRDYIDSAIRYCLSGEGYQQYIKEWAADLLNLEKQKEQKPIVTVDLEEAADTYANKYDDINSNAKTYVAFKAGAEWQRRQKPAEWSEDWREENIQTRFAFYTYKDDPSVLYLSNVFVEETSRNHGFGTRILRAAEKVAEAIGATTISLKVKQNSPANAWYRKNGYGYVAFEDGYDWLEKNLEYMKPNKQEWSEEDEKMRKRAICACNYVIEKIMDDGHYQEARDWLESLPTGFIVNPHYNEDTVTLLIGELQQIAKDHNAPRQYDAEISWLKSLRPPQYCENCKLKRSVENWKPSEEQMNALYDILHPADPVNLDAVKSLYNDLKKLL